MRELMPRVGQRRMVSVIIVLAFCCSATLGVLVTYSLGRIDAAAGESPNRNAKIPARALTLTVHAPILIDGNSLFTSENGVVSGGGTASNPYIIADWDITAVDVSCISIYNTTAHFTVIGCHVQQQMTDLGPDHGGLHLFNCTNGRLENNYCSGYDAGILIDSSNNNTLVNNTCAECSYFGISMRLSNYSTLTNNTCMENRYGAVHLAESNNNTVSDNTCFNNWNWWGIVLSSSNNNTIVSNKLGSNGNAISMSASNNNSIMSNHCSSNTGDGIGMGVDCYDNEISRNLICNNARYGLNIGSTGTSGNRIWNNTFIGNNGATDVYNATHAQAYDEGARNWWNSTNGYGNCWSDWRSPDLDGDGVVDNPYAIYGYYENASDYYPLIEFPGETVPQDSTLILSGTVGSDGWYTSSVRLHMAFATMYRFDDNPSWCVYVLPLTVSADGYHTLYFYLVDYVNCSQSLESVAFKVDKTLPAGTLSIQNGSTYANSTAVDLTVTVYDAISGVDQIRFSNDDASWTAWEDFSESRGWTLSVGDGSKMVYCQIIDSAGLVFAVSDNITLDTTIPSLEFEIVDGTSLTNRSYAIEWIGTDVYGIDRFECSLDGNAYESVGLATQIEIDGLTDGTHNLSVRAIDNAGNIAQKNLVFEVHARLILDIMCDVSTASFGSGIWITGSISYAANATEVPGLTLMVYYSVTDGATWNEISSVTTGSAGSYSVLWMPAATGEYIVKVAWPGNIAHYPCENQARLVVTPYTDEFVFAVQSNSIVGSLEFDASARELSFTVSGEPETIGYSRIFISKALMEDASEAVILVDGLSVDFVLSSTTDSWVLYFTYAHSEHTIVASLGPITEKTAMDPPLLAGVLAAAIAIIVVAILVLRKRRVDK